jgi:hypothetical protein
VSRRVRSSPVQRSIRSSWVATVVIATVAVAPLRAVCSTRSIGDEGAGAGHAGWGARDRSR